MLKATQLLLQSTGRERTANCEFSSEWWTELSVIASSLEHELCQYSLQLLYWADTVCILCCFTAVPSAAAPHCVLLCTDLVLCETFEVSGSTRATRVSYLLTFVLTDSGRLAALSCSQLHTCLDVSLSRHVFTQHSIHRPEQYEPVWCVHCHMQHERKTRILFTEGEMVDLHLHLFQVWSRKSCQTCRAGLRTRTGKHWTSTWFHSSHQMSATSFMCKPTVHIK